MNPQTGEPRVLLVGVDQAILHLIVKFTSEQALPCISRLIKGGVLAEAFPCIPCDTPTNWTTIATGAPTAIHGSTSFYTHVPGEPFELGLKQRSRAQLSRWC
ncbi:hypothetical protein GF325_04260, partial [Candidatus Bathyarchaeota archaeon]|nr:hypothetical protein [Candidatus Bathyarchaeota archaeon]